MSSWLNSLNMVRIGKRFESVGAGLYNPNKHKNFVKGVKGFLDDFELLGDPKKARIALKSIQEMKRPAHSQFFKSNELADCDVRTFFACHKLSRWCAGNLDLRELASQDNNISMLSPISPEGQAFFILDTGMFFQIDNLHDPEKCFRLLYMASKNFIGIEKFDYMLGERNDIAPFELAAQWEEIFEQGLRHVDDWKADVMSKERIYGGLGRAMLKDRNGLNQLLASTDCWWSFRKKLSSYTEQNDCNSEGAGLSGR